MQQNEITVSRKPIIYAIGFLIFAFLLILAIKFSFSRSGHSPNAVSTEDSELAAVSLEKFALLSGQGGQRSVGST
jgi:hypothetical protein